MATMSVMYTVQPGILLQLQPAAESHRLYSLLSVDRLMGFEILFFFALHSSTNDAQSRCKVV